MEVAGKTRTGSRGRLISISVIALAVALALYAFHESNTHPTSSDSSIDADVVHVAAAVGGRIIQLPVVENMRVAEGSLLFQIDPLPYRLAVEQSAAELGIAADYSPRGAEGFTFAVLTSIINLANVFSNNLGSYLFTQVFHSKLAPLVLLSAGFTAFAFVLVPLLRLGDKRQGEPAAAARTGV